ncbi:hypothetical protein [Streptomyces sp. G45]|uniref:hypothetical protein n=1 Tax=Streptomyces sp. G45 TaxID=3406627 RepID=UPI003C170C8A
MARQARENQPEDQSRRSRQQAGDKAQQQASEKAKQEAEKKAATRKADDKGDDEPPQTRAATISDRALKTDVAAVEW